MAPAASRISGRKRTVKMTATTPNMSHVQTMKSAIGLTHRRIRTDPTPRTMKTAATAPYRRTLTASVRPSIPAPLPSCAIDGIRDTIGTASARQPASDPRMIQRVPRTRRPGRASLNPARGTSPVDACVASLRLPGNHGTQSAMKTFVSPGFALHRFDAKTSFLPSRVNIGKPSNVSFQVILSRPVPSSLIA